MEQAAFGAGCFWHVEETFQAISGVIRTEAGYTGGKTKNPTYDDVCTDETGHAEAVHLEYDPKIVSYKELLKVFWSIHDPAQKNRQGLDVGTQYRSAIFYYTQEQKKIAELSKKSEQEKYSRQIVTEISPAGVFYHAEEYHQKYLVKAGKKTCGL